MPPISDDPDHVMAQINKVSANLLDVSLDGFSVFKTSLEYFVQLSEKMLQLIEAITSSHFPSTMIAIMLLKEKDTDLKDSYWNKIILIYISYDRNSELYKYEKDITGNYMMNSTQENKQCKAYTSKNLVCFQF